MDVHETHEKIEEAHGHEKKRAALLIIALAVVLAITEMAGKEAQFSALSANIQSSDIYAFYQAKTIRATMLRTAIESAGALAPTELDRDGLRQKQLSDWKSQIERLDSEPATGDGRKELLERARVVEVQRDRYEHAYHDYEFGSASLELAIVIASASVITEVALLEVVSGGLGIVGIGFALIGWLSPSLLHL